MTLLEHAQAIASGSVRNYDESLYRWWPTLYRHANGRYLVYRHGGAAIGGRGVRRWLDGRDEAIEWIATRATDPITGYGYTREQAAIMLDGGDAGKGYRGQ